MAGPPCAPCFRKPALLAGSSAAEDPRVCPQATSRTYCLIYFLVDFKRCDEPHRDRTTSGIENREGAIRLLTGHVEPSRITVTLSSEPDRSILRVLPISGRVY